MYKVHAIGNVNIIQIFHGRYLALPKAKYQLIVRCFINYAATLS